MRNYIRRYRQDRELGLARRHALRSALPLRLQMGYALVRGRPVGYRLKIIDGTLTFGSGQSGAVVGQCSITYSSVMTATGPAEA
jgi:hypothetical protein